MSSDNKTTSPCLIELLDASAFKRVFDEDCVAAGALVESSRAASANSTTSDSLQELEELRKVVPPKYHDFLDVFCASSANSLPPHCSYDHSIELEPGTSPPLGPIFRLSEVELETLRTYQDKKPRKGFYLLLQFPSRSSDPLR